MSNIHIQGRDIQSRILVGVVGQLVDADPLNDLVTIINSDPQALQTYTVTVTTVTNSATYTFTADGTDISYTADSSATDAEIVAGLKAAFDAEPTVRGMFTSAATSATVLTLTAIGPEIDIVMSDADSKLTTTETVAPANAAVVNFGRAIINLQTSNDEGTDCGGEVYAAKLTAQVDTATITYAAGEAYYFTIDIPGQTPLMVGIAANTDSNTTATDIRAAINAIMPANTVVAAGSTNVVSLTSEIAGQPFTTTVGLKTGTISRLALVHTTSGPLTDINQCLAGISVMTLDNEIPTIGGDSASYPANSGVVVLNKGRIYVNNSEAPTTSDKVYVKLTAGSTQGEFTKTPASTNVLWGRASWGTIPSRTSGDDLAVIKLAY
tara:strand:- start:2144 stop:3283 length:1140 start_codon:yes stop_codon:yes gene_type:complete